MKKSGFTLVELLATILILAVILVITVPILANVTDNSKADVLVKNNEMLLKAAQNYILSNYNSRPAEIGDITEVTLSQLQSGNFIGSIKSPYDKTELCDGYVLVTKTGVGGYDYTPYLDCANNISSATNDNLIGYWKFDDFQEPTTNLLNNPSGDTITNSTPGAYKPGWDTSLHTDAITVASWGTGYNGGVPSPTIGYHAKWVYKNSNNTNPIMMFTDENNAYSLGHRWLGISQDFGTGTALGLQAGQQITISWDQKANILGKGADVGLHHNLISTGSTSFETNRKILNVTNINKWQRVSFTSTISADWDLTKFTKIYVYGNTGNYGKLWVDNVQVEKKDHATAFVQGSRTATIRDYSINKNHVSLSETTTPTWVEDSAVGDGAYQFDGVNDYISLPTSLNAILNNSSFTLSAWIKSSGMGSGMSLGGIISLTYGLNMVLTPAGNLRIRMDNGSSLQTFDTSGVNLIDNKFHFVTATYDGTYVRLYIDGVQAKEAAATWNNRYSNTTIIGYDSNNPSVYKYYGIIDDVRIYKRALNADEIKQIYTVEAR